MQNSDYWLGLVLTLIMAMVVLRIVVESADSHDEVVYDCRLAEISVDYPQQVKEQCRKLLLKKDR